MDGFRDAVIEQLEQEASPEHRAIAALMAIPVRVQEQMTGAEIDAVIASVAKAIRRASKTQEG